MTSTHDFVTTSPDFGSQAGWSAGYALAKGHGGPGVVVGPGRDNPNVFAQVFAAHGGEQYRVVADASSVNGTHAVASIQINWLGRVGNLVSVSSADFSVGRKPKEFEFYVQAPRHAKAGTLYVVPGPPADAAVRYTEMGLTRLDPLKDFVHYRFLGVTGLEATLSVFALMTMAIVLRFFSKTAAGIVRYASDCMARFFPLFAVAACVVTLFLLKGAYEQNYDAQYHQGLFEIVMRWSNFSFDLGGDPMMSFGIQPIGNPRLSPTYLLGDLVASDIRIPTEAAFQCVIMLLILARLVWKSGARFNEAYAIALVAIGYCWIPYLSAEAITLDATLGLLWQESAIAALLAFFFFTMIGLGDKPARLWPPLGLAGTILWCFVTLPAMIPFFTLTTLSLCVGAICAAESRREFLHKAAYSTAIVAGLALLGVYGYVRYIFMYTPQMYYTTLYSQNFNDLFFTNTSLLLAADRLGGARLYIFFSLAIVGGVCALYYGNRFAHRIVFAAIGLEVMIHVMSALNVVFKFVPLTFTYIEQMGIPVVAMLAGAGVWAILKITSFGIAKLVAMTTIGQAAKPTPAANSS